MEVTKENVPDVVILDTELFDEMLLHVRALLHMRDGMRLAMTAAAAGVALPGTLMQTLGVDVDEEALKRFRSLTPALITHDEDGAVLPAAPRLSESTAMFADDEDDLVHRWVRPQTHSASRERAHWMLSSGLNAKSLQ